MLKNYLIIPFLLLGLITYSQSNTSGIPTHIPKNINGKFGYINSAGKVVIKPEYKLAMFFSEDCNLLNSPNILTRKYGSKNYATVEKNNVLYRINKLGKRVKRVTEKDLGVCNKTFVQQPLLAYRYKGSFGVVERADIDPANPEDYIVAPVYQLIHIMEGKDLQNPMIVAVRNNKFGVIDKFNNIVIPFMYDDIKRNFSWKIANLFEVTKDGKNYFFIDKKNKMY